MRWKRERAHMMAPATGGWFLEIGGLSLYSCVHDRYSTQIYMHIVSVKFRYTYIHLQCTSTIHVSSSKCTICNIHVYAFFQHMIVLHIVHVYTCTCSEQLPRLCCECMHTYMHVHVHERKQPKQHSETL